MRGVGGVGVYIPGGGDLIVGVDVVVSTEVQEQILKWNHNIFDETQANHDDPTLIIIEWNEINLANRNLDKNVMITRIRNAHNELRPFPNAALPSVSIFFIVTHPDNSMDVAVNVAYGNNGFQTNYRIPNAPSLGRIFSVEPPEKTLLKSLNSPTYFNIVYEKDRLSCRWGIAVYAMVDTSLVHAIESVVSMYPPGERLEENSADEDKVDKSRSSSMEPRKEKQTRMKISSKEVTEFITDMRCRWI
ncbi:hypothetical protein C1646_753356 [Rhizophagus diaphanus]|nr:hypothetical protein C1646_753356 [Rhizophagus diaphanus] [Rhizophagus sp. MUCL 43196]